MDKSHMTVGKSSRVLAWIYSFVSSQGVIGNDVSTITDNQERPRGSEWKTVAVALHENEKLGWKNKTKKERRHE